MTITDDSGFLAILNPDTYKSFVAEDWQLSQLMDHFVYEMNKRNLIFWATGAHGRWNVSFVDNCSNKIAFREFTATIHVTTGVLFLTNYDDLSLAAQFEDETLPSDHHADLKIKLENGFYNLNVRQLFDADNLDHEASEKLNFEIVIQKTNQETETIDKIQWWLEKFNH